MVSAASNFLRFLGGVGGGDNALTRLSDRMNDPFNAVGTLQDRTNRNQQLGRILSGQTIPAFARPGGAEPDSPENIRRAQMAQLAELGTPEALTTLGTLSPLTRQPEELPSNIRTLGHLLENPELMQPYQDVFGKASTNINVNTGDGLTNVAQKEAAKKYGAGMGDLTIGRLKQANEASQQNLQLDLMEDALTRGAKTGFGQNTIATIQNAYSSLTGTEPPEGLGATELVKSFGNQFALRLRNPDSGLGLPGAASNKDIQFLQSMSPNLINSLAGNREIIGSYRKINKFKIDLAKRQSDLIKQNKGNIPADLESQLQDYVANYEILTPEERARIMAVKEIGYNSPEEVGSAYQRGDISKEEAVKFLNKLGVQ